jgi:AcrR family transcriptional regulator
MYAARRMVRVLRKRAVEAEEVIDPRARLIEGMGLALRERAYGELTISEIVKHARVSKRTFYEHFVDKQECFLTLYSDFSLGLLRDVAVAADGAEVGEPQIAAAASAYFTALERDRALVRGIMHGAHAAGLPAVMLHHKFLARFAAQITVMVERGRRVHKDVVSLSGAHALAIVGGINEMMVVHIEMQPSVPLTALVPTVIAFARAVIFGPRGEAMAAKR